MDEPTTWSSGPPEPDDDETREVEHVDDHPTALPAPTSSYPVLPTPTSETPPAVPYETPSPAAVDGAVIEQAPPDEIAPDAIAPDEMAPDQIQHEVAPDEIQQETAPDEGEPPSHDEPQVTTAPGPSDGERTRRRLTLRRSSEAKPAVPAASSRKRTKKLIGLKIGASQLAAARVVNNGHAELLDVVREPLAPGLVVSGEIRDPDALAVALERFFELHKLPKKGIRLGLSNNRIGVRVLEIDGVTDARQLDNAIRFRAEEVLPIPLDEAVLDYVVLEEDVREDGTPLRRILLVVAYREVVERYLQACRGAGLEVVGVDLEAFALLRSLVEPSAVPPKDGALVAAAVGHDRTTIAVSNGRFCEFTRVLDWGGWSLNVAIARELDVPPNEVEAIKRQLSFTEVTGPDGLSPEQVAKARDAAQRALATFARELVASLQFYQAQPGALGIGQIVVTGGTAHMPGFPEAVGRLIGVPVRLGDPFERVKLGKKLHADSEAGSLAIAIGLGIED